MIVGVVLAAGPALAEPDPHHDRTPEPTVGGRGTISSSLSPADRLSPPPPSTDPRVAVQADADCSQNANPIVCENTLPGTARSQWDIPTRDSGGGSIAGFATQMSVNHGETVDFKIRTDAAAYTVEIYRLGYYQGLGARHVGSAAVTEKLPQSQPACVFQPATDLVDCGTWAV
ncbi:hypothetical protein, partial [Intrasporangium oryzae]|uniref:hypothetical protein n=1 Tax=Intrasporangium oryzae TaxID=412687 RepID=UPI001B7F79F0